MSNLYMDTQQVKANIAALMSEYPELQDDEELHFDMLEGETDLNEIITRILSEKLEADAMADAVKSRMTDLQARKQRYEKKGQMMRGLIKSLMDTAQIDKMTLPEASLSIRQSPVSVDVTDLEALPQGFFKVERKADKTAIKTAIKAGEEIPGAELVEGSPTLSVRKT